MFKARRRQLELLSSSEIELMREAGQLAATLLAELGAMVAPGISTQDLDDHAVEFAKKHGVVNAPFQYQGNAKTPFPRSICTSVNHVICHGIPNSKHILKEGDLVSVDVTVRREGFHGDTCSTFPVGAVSDDAQSLMQITAESLRLGLLEVRPGRRIGAIGAAIQKYAEGNGYGVVREFQGHGIGRKFHTAPDVPHFGRQTDGIKMRKGMAFTIEPMVNTGHWRVKILDDGWTAETEDGSLSAQYEHTVIVTEDGVEVTTLKPGDDPFAVSPGDVISFSAE